MSKSATCMVYHVDPQKLARLLRKREQNGEATRAMRNGDLGEGIIHFGWGAVRVFFQEELARWCPPQKDVTYEFRWGTPPELASAEKDVSRAWGLYEQRSVRALLHVSNVLVEVLGGKQYRKCINGAGGVIWVARELTDFLSESADELRRDLRFEELSKETLRVSKPQNPYAMARGTPTTYEAVAYIAPMSDLKEHMGANLPLDSPVYLFTCLLCGRCEQDQEDDTVTRQTKMYAHLMDDHVFSQEDILCATRGERREWVISEDRAGILRLPQKAFLQAAREDAPTSSGPERMQVTLED